MYRILLVEDDSGIAQAICEQGAMWELDMRCVRNFHDVLGEFTAYDPQLVLMDISLPFFNGYHWCSEIRRVSRVPIIFLSSAAGQHEHRHGHEHGAVILSPSPLISAC